MKYRFDERRSFGPSLEWEQLPVLRKPIRKRGVLLRLEFAVLLAASAMPFVVHWLS